MLHVRLTLSGIRGSLLHSLNMGFAVSATSRIYFSSTIARSHGSERQRICSLTPAFHPADSFPRHTHRSPSTSPAGVVEVVVHPLAHAIHAMLHMHRGR